MEDLGTYISNKVLAGATGLGDDALRTTLMRKRHEQPNYTNGK